MDAPANCPGAMGIAGLRHAGTKVGYSSLGPEIALSAPAGNCVNTAAGTPCLYSLDTTTNAGTTTPATNTYTDQFNSNLGTAGCLTGIPWYYGFDHNEGSGIDLLAVLLHEFGHGLGFSTTTSGTTGNFLNGPPALPAVWDQFLFDETAGLHWSAMTPAQRVSSAINTGHLVWDGQQVNFQGPLFLIWCQDRHVRHVRLTGPNRHSAY